jgi:predicted TIM-barrel fold metal-dependent hydrolase
MNVNVSRRSLLAGFGATGLSATLPGALLSAADAGFIDVHHHHVPPALAAAATAYAAKTGTPVAGPIKDWTREKSLASMDANGVATSVLVLANGTGIWDLNDPASLRRMARACNEYGAEMVRAYPGRYAFFAWLPVPDIAGCLDEIAYALDHLGAAGIGFYTSYGTRWAGDKAFTPIYDELDRRKAVAYYHPLAPACCNDLIPGVRDNYTEFPQDTARAVTSLLFNGQLATHRNIKWIFSHAGGPVPVYAGRIQALATPRDLDKIAPEGIVAELARLNFETANANYQPNIDAALDLVPLSHLVFGTDYPYVSVESNVKSFGTLKISPAARRAIARENALRLIPGLPGGK